MTTVEHGLENTGVDFRLYTKRIVDGNIIFSLGDDTAVVKLDGFHVNARGYVEQVTATVYRSDGTVSKVFPDDPLADHLGRIIEVNLHEFYL